MITFALAALVALGVFLAYALCRAASNGDRMMRE